MLDDDGGEAITPARGLQRGPIEQARGEIGGIEGIAGAGGIDDTRSAGTRRSPSGI
jgi:hypothetical protein